MVEVENNDVCFTAIYARMFRQIIDNVLAKWNPMLSAISTCLRFIVRLVLNVMTTVSGALVCRILVRHYLVRYKPSNEPTIPPTV